MKNYWLRRLLNIKNDFLLHKVIHERIIHQSLWSYLQGNTIVVQVINTNKVIYLP